MANLEVVVARYNEDISWAEQLPAVVYNKGASLQTSLPQRTLANFGREGHTYLYHITRFWHSLADTTLFCQGRTTDHLPTGVDIHQLCNPAHELVVPRLFNWHEWGPDGKLRHFGIWQQQYETGVMRHARLSIVDWFQNYLNIDIRPMEALLFNPGACFGVKRDLIYRRPLSFYERIMATVDDHVNPEEGYYLERAWLYIFSVPSVNVVTLSR